MTSTIIHSEMFNNLSFGGVDIGAYPTSDKYAVTNYYTINDFKGWHFAGNTYYTLDGTSTDGAVILNEGPPGGTASTTVTGLISGQTYTLSFDVWGDNEPGLAWVLNVSVDGTLLLTANGVDQQPGTNPGTTETISFVATGTSAFLEFSQASVTLASPIIDNVQVIAERVTSYTVTIDGTDAIFLAGRSDLLIPHANLSWGDFDAGTYDGMLRHSSPTPEEALETLPSTIPVTGGSVLQVVHPATGGMNFFNGFGAPYFGPDGNDALASSSNITPFAGISGYIGPQGALAGVFLTDAIPDGSPPSTLDFSSAEIGVDFPSLSPQMGQIFFIGDGQTSGGMPQQFVAPEGATRLALGIADGFGFIGVPGAYDDNDGAYQITLGVVATTNQPPVANADVRTATEDVALAAASVLANDTDADGHDLHISAVQVSGVTITDGGVGDLDGASNGSIQFTTVMGGRATINLDDGTFGYDQNGVLNGLAAGESGADSFKYQATDGSATSNFATVSLTINGVNDTPIALPDTATIQKGGTVTGNVIANDSDPDHDTLIIGGQSVKGSYGILRLDDEGNYSYTANSNAKVGAQDVFTYSVSDGHVSVQQSLIVTLQADAGNSLNSARNLGTLGSASYAPISEWVGIGDPADYFKFNFSGNERLKLSITGLNGNADLYLLDNSGKTIQSSTLTANSSEVVLETLTTGTYYVKVQYESGNTDYDLNFAFNPIPSIPLPFASNYSDMYVTQGWGVAKPSHKGDLYYALDLSRPGGPAGIDALSVGNNGTVVDYRDNVGDDQSGNNGYGNYITIKYTTSQGEEYFVTYLHLQAGSITAALRDEIPSELLVTLQNATTYADLDVGNAVGKIGDTGWGKDSPKDYLPHLHFQFSDDRMSLKFSDGYTGYIADASKANGQTHNFISQDFAYDGDGRADIPDDSLAAYADFVGYEAYTNNEFWFL